MIKIVGLDIAKNVFQVHGVDETGQAALRRKLRRAEVLRLFRQLEPALVGMEACHTAHHWGREIAALGHEVRLMPPQFVRPYVKSQKNDAADAEAICEAVQRPTMRFVPVKGADQQAVLLLHRTRDLLIRQRSSLISAIRAHFAEFGVVVGQRMRNIDRLLELLVAEGTGLPELARRMLAVLADQLRDVAARVAVMEGGADGLASGERGEPAACHHSRGGADHRERDCGDGWGRDPVQVWPAVRRLAGAGAATAVERRQGAPGPDLEARRRVHSSADDPRRQGCGRMAQTPAHGRRPLARWAAGASPRQRRDGGVRQQERAHRLGADGARQDLHHRPSARCLTGAHGR